MCGSCGRGGVLCEKMMSKTFWYQVECVFVLSWRCFMSLRVHGVSYTYTELIENECCQIQCVERCVCVE